MSERLEMECKRCGDNEDRIDGFCSNECKDKYSLEEALSKMSIRIAELESLVERLIEIGDWATIGMVISNSYSLTSEMRELAEDRHDEWKMLVKGWKSSKQKEAYDLDEYKDNPEESEK